LSRAADEFWRLPIDQGEPPMDFGKTPIGCGATPIA